MIFDKEWRRQRRIKKVYNSYKSGQEDIAKQQANNARRLLNAIYSGDVKAIRFYCNYFDSKGVDIPNSIEQIEQWVEDVER